MRLKININVSRLERATFLCVTFLLMMEVSPAYAIWSHLITQGTPVQTKYLGDNLGADYNVQYEINEGSWNNAYVGIGPTNTLGNGWSWYSAFWYNDDGANRQIQSNLGTNSNGVQFTETGNWYFAGKVVYGWGTTYAAGDWAEDELSLSASHYFSVAALTNPASILIATNTASSHTKIDLSWSQWNSKNVMVVRGTNATFFTPSGGTAYSVGYTSADDIVIYNSSGTNWTDTNLTYSTKYYYKLYSENYKYYSDGISTNETTAAGPQPAISYSPATMTFDMKRGLIPGSQNLYVTNNAGQTMYYTNTISYGSGSGWLSIATPNTLGPGVGESRAVSITTSNVTVGAHVATNTITGNFTNSSQTVVVTLNVTDPGDPTNTAAAVDGTFNATKIDLAWDENAQSADVMVVRSTDDSFHPPTNAAAYAQGDSLGGDAVIYKGGAGAFEDSSLDEGTTYYYKLYSEYYGFYSAGATTNVTTVWPMTQNTEGGSPQVTASLFVGDTATFGCDSWASYNDGSGAKWQVVVDTDSNLSDGTGSGFGGSYVSSLNKTATHQFTNAATYYWGMQVDYDGMGSDHWYVADNGSWVDMASDGTSASLSVAVNALTNPASVTVITNAANPNTKIDLSWSKWNGRNVMVVRGTNASFFTPSGGTGYSVGYTSGDDTVIYNDSATSCTDTGLTVGVKYHYRLFSENFSYYSDGVDTNYTILLPEMAVTGNGYAITNGATPPVVSNYTDFGDVLLAGGAVERTFTVENNGSVTLNLSGVPTVVVAGTHAADFSLTSGPGSSSIAADGSTTFAITFNPSAVGTRSASLSITNNDVTENPYTFSIQGTGVEPEMGVLGNGFVITNGDVSPVTTDGTDFGSVAIAHDSVTHTFAITNTGSGILSLTNSTRVAISGHDSDFTVQSQPAVTVSVDGSRSFTIRFAPTAYGARTGTVSIANTDADEDPYTFSVEGSAYKAAFIDDFGVGKGAPLCIDLDDDGVSDAWEIEYFGNTSSNWNGDADGDGWSNLQEYLAGTNPTNSSSFFHIASGGLEDNTSTNIQLSLVGGNFSGPTNYFEVGDAIGRVYRIYAADGSVANPKTLLATVSEGLTGTNVWTDTGVTESVTRRYYEVEVVYAGGAYTNTEEWALYVEPRTTNRSHLVCVPVDYGSTAANNLNSTLGEQLATGLNSSDTEAEADKVRLIDGAGNWAEYYLSEAVGWTTNGTVTANVTITPGQAIWVVNGSNAAVRSNAVFVGRSFEGGDMVDTTFKTNNGGWTVFGWPLANTRQAVSTLGTADQLGFSSKGTGGTTWETNSATHGDRLWVPDGDGGWDWFWLYENGRWYTGDGGSYGDITLSPGVAYYYYHTTSSGGTNFNWKPVVP